MKKFSFWTPKALFLGCVGLQDGLEVDESKIKPVKNLPRPSTISKVHSFHGLASFQKQFIPHFSTIIALITDCIKGAKFVCTEEVEEVFKLIKRRLTTTPIMLLPDFHLPFKLHSDAFKQGLVQF